MVYLKGLFYCKYIYLFTTFCFLFYSDVVLPISQTLLWFFLWKCCINQLYSSLSHMHSFGWLTHPCAAGFLGHREEWLHLKRKAGVLQFLLDLNGYLKGSHKNGTQNCCALGKCIVKYLEITHIYGVQALPSSNTPKPHPSLVRCEYRLRTNSTQMPHTRGVQVICTVSTHRMPVWFSHKIQFVLFLYF